MPDSFDPRLLRVTFEISGQAYAYAFEGRDGAFIETTGTKFAGALQNEAAVKIANLSRADRDFFLTECSPYNRNRTPKKLKIEAGRKSTGYSQVFVGDIVSCDPTPAPDITLHFKAQTGSFLKGKVISASRGKTSKVSQVGKGIADTLGLGFVFQGEDKAVSNYNFTGGALKQMDGLAQMGDFDAFIDDEQLILKAAGAPLSGSVRVLSADSGMVGIPQPTEFGIKVTYLFDKTSRVGGGLQLDSAAYKSLNALYSIYKLGWNLTSRNTPFYWVADCVRRSESGAIVRPNPVPKGGSK